MGGEHGEDEDEDEGEDAGRGMQRRRRNESWESAACRSFRGKEKWRLAFASQHNTSLTRLVTLQEFDALTAPARHKHQAVLRSSRHISIRTPVVSEHQRCNPVSFPFSKSFI